MRAVWVSSCYTEEQHSSDCKMSPLVRLQGTSLPKLLNAIKWLVPLRLCENAEALQPPLACLSLIHTVQDPIKMTASF